MYTYTYPQNPILIKAAPIALKPPKKVTLDDVLIACGYHFSMPVHQIIGRTRKERVVVARHAYCYLAKEVTNHSIKEIGRKIGGRDYTTVCYAINAISNCLNSPDRKSLAIAENVKTLLDQLQYAS